MADYTFTQLFTLGTASSFDPLTQTLDLEVPATQVTLVDNMGMTDVTVGGRTITLNMSLRQIVGTGALANLIPTTGALWVGDNTTTATIDNLASNFNASGMDGSQFQGLAGSDTFIGSAFGDVAYGNEDADLIWGRLGDDTIYGGQNATGLDMLMGQGGNDLIYGDQGMDYINGHSGNDTLYGEQAGDTIYGGAGHDVIDAGTGHDIAAGGTGNDIMHGGAGNDILHGGLGNDQIWGDGGFNIIYGNQGDDVLYGDATTGNWIYGGQGFDKILAGAGNDLIYGNMAVDNLSAGGGNDTVYGGQGNDTITGGAGDDVIHANRGSDVIYGGGGGDIFHFRAGNGTDVNTIWDYTYGSDSLFLTGVTVKSTLQVGTDVQVTLTSGDVILIKNAASNQVAVDLNPWLPSSGGGGGAPAPAPAPAPTPTNSPPTVTGPVISDKTEQDALYTLDLLTGATDPNGDVMTVTGLTLTGGDASGIVDNGNGTLEVTPAAYSALATGVQEVITYSYTIDDGAGGTIAQTATITITGLDATTGPDVITGTPNPDTLDGLAGDDIIDGLASGDSLVGNLGTDTLSYQNDTGGVTGSFGNNVQTIITDGSAGADTVESFEVFEGSNLADSVIGTGTGAVTMFGRGGNDTLKGSAGADELYGNSGADWLEGLTGADTLMGGKQDDTIWGGADGDSLLGGSGADTLIGENGGDFLDGGTGNDYLHGGNGNDTMYGQLGADTLDGATGADTLYGGSGADSMNGGNGNDWLFGGTGNDILKGSGGADTIVAGWGADTMGGGTGKDVFVWESKDDFGAGAGAPVTTTVTIAGNQSAVGKYMPTISGSGWLTINYAGWALSSLTFWGTLSKINVPLFDSIRGKSSYVSGLPSPSWFGVNLGDFSAPTMTLPNSRNTSTIAFTSSSGMAKLVWTASDFPIFYDGVYVPSVTYKKTTVGAGSNDIITDFAPGSDKLVFDAAGIFTKNPASFPSTFLILKSASAGVIGYSIFMTSSQPSMANPLVYTGAANAAALSAWGGNLKTSGINVSGQLKFYGFAINNASTLLWIYSASQSKVQALGGDATVDSFSILHTIKFNGGAAVSAGDILLV